MTIILQEDVDKAIARLEKSKIDVVTGGYVLVVNKDHLFCGVGSPIPILVKDYCPRGAWYLIKREDLEK